MRGRPATEIRRSPTSAHRFTVPQELPHGRQVAGNHRARAAKGLDRHQAKALTIAVFCDNRWKNDHLGSTKNLRQAPVGHGA
jgi:hypothetical protein